MKIFMLCVLLALAGVVMTIAGFGSPPDEPLAVLRWLGVACIGGGVILAGLYLFFFRS